MSLNKFTHILLLKNDAKLNFFFLKWQITTQKKQSPKIFYKNKKVPKKIKSSKNKNKLSCPSPKKSKEKKIRKKKEAMLMPKKKKKKKKKRIDNWQNDCPEKRKKKGQCYW